VTIRKTTITKLQQLPESLVQEVSDFIDFVIYKHQSIAGNDPSQNDAAETWANWFEAVDRLDVISTDPASSYQQLLLNKYRQQGLDL
jgi:Protein of unknown function (DUF2281)